MTNCLIKNLYESVSLPHIRNLHENNTQLSSVKRETGGRNEVNDAGEEESDGNHSATVSEGQKEGKRHDIDRVH